MVHTKNPNYEEFGLIESLLKYRGIPCTKYNYCLSEKDNSAENTVMSIIRLSENGKELLLYNQYEIEPIRIKENLTHYTKGMFENEELRKKQEEEERNRVIEYSEKLSNSSCKVADITGFIYGGFSSRFWMLRKQITSMELPEFKNQTFFSWEAISIET